MIDGIVLKKQPYQETSELLTILTRDIGKINVLARGSLKPNGPLFGATQLYTYGVFDIHLRSGLSTMYKAETKRLYEVSSDIYSQIGYAYIAELFLYCFEERIATPILFDWVIEGYTILKQPELLYYVLTKTLFLFQKIIDEPLVYTTCVHCQKKDASMIGFSFWNRGFICQDCQNHLQYEIEPRLMRLLIALEKDESLDFTQMSIDEWKMLFNHYTMYFQEQLGIIPKSTHVLKQL
ncbi:MAG: DNA repair protein RecO [Culicoidibacterales bacterium]